MGRMIEEMESKLRNSLDQVLWFLACVFQLPYIPSKQLKLYNILKK